MHGGGGDHGIPATRDPGDLLTLPLSIGPLTVPGRLMMAPMAGLTTSALRRTVRRFGAALVFSEMVSAAGLHYRTRRTLEYVEFAPDEHPVGCQLFGAEPGIMAEAAAICVEAGADLIDINMACPVKKVMRTGSGAALMDDPGTAIALVAATAGAVEGRVPVTVKLRAGVRAGERTVLDLGPRLAEAGAAALCLHPRSAAQLYRGQADHELTERLAGAVEVPVLASGDVTDRAICLDLLDRGAAGVMVARAAIGQPWIFAEILENRRPAERAERFDELRRFVDDVIAESGRRAVGHLRQFWPRYRRSGTLSRDEQTELMAAKTVAEVRAILARIAPIG